MFSRYLYVIGSEGATELPDGRGYRVHVTKKIDYTVHGGDFQEIYFNVWYLDNKSLRFNVRLIFSNLEFFFYSYVLFYVLA